jgi:hypothetical protein
MAPLYAAVRERSLPERDGTAHPRAMNAFLLRCLRAGLPLALVVTLGCADPAATRLVAGATGGAAASGSSSSGTAMTPAAPGSVRFANLSSTLAPFDVCSGDGDGLLATDGLAQGLVFGQVSRYLPAAPHASWAMVAPGGACSDPSSVPLTIPWPAGAEDGRVTLVPWRVPVDAGEGTLVYAFLDDPSNDQVGINLRVLDFTEMETGIPAAHTSYVMYEGPGDAAPVVLFSELRFAEIPTMSSLGMVSAAGFVHTTDAAVGNLEIVPDLYVAPLSFHGDVPVCGGLGDASGVGSIFVAGPIIGGSARAVICSDDSPPVGALSGCATLAPTIPGG